MDLTWWAVIAAGCVALAGCLAFALLRPRAARSEELQPLANTSRLTRLPEYRRALRWHTITAGVTMTLLLAALAATTVTAARPTGLPSTNRHHRASQPEDIMVCVGAPVTDTAVRSSLTFFAGAIGDFGTERIGLTSANRRIVPLTRDYQYATEAFSRYSEAAQQHGDLRPFVSPVSYAGYAESTTDLLALCMTGFPSFPARSAHRRSLVYIAPRTCAIPGRSQLFEADRVRNLAVNADIQVNALLTGSCAGELPALARSTSGRALRVDADASAQLRDIRSHAPPDSSMPAGVAGGPAETPDVPLSIAIAVVVMVSAWTVVVHR